MPKQLDSTAKDLAQDAKEAQDIAKQEKAFAAIGAKEQDTEIRLKNLEQQMTVLAPLRDLIQHITQIKRVLGAGS